MKRILLALVLISSSALAQQPGSLDALRQAFEKQSQSLLSAYGKALENTIAELKKKGDLETYLVLEAETKRFETEKTVPVPASAKDSLRPAAEAYYRGLADVLRKYGAAIERLIKQSMQQDKIDEAKALKVEKDKAAFMLADTETKLPDGGAAKGRDGADPDAEEGDDAPRYPGARTGAVMSTNDLMKLFAFPDNTWRIDDKALTGTIGPFTPVWLKKPVKTRSFDFSFSILARWYHMVKIRINDAEYGYSRGHWGNTAAVLYEPGAERQKKEGRVEKPEEWHKLRAVLSSDTLTFHYDGKVVGSFKVNLNGKPKPSVVVGFDSYTCPCSVKDVVLKVKD